jgi:ATP-dependent RNA helicase DDX51/DBP6
VEALHFKGVLKGAGHEKKVKKVKVREEDLAPYKQSYEVSRTSWRGVACR